MSLHNFNPNNKSWKMYSNTITSISGDNLTIKPYDGKNLLLEVSGNNNIFFKKGDISYGLDDLIDTNITLTSVSGDIIPSNDNAFKLGDVSKNWSNAYIRDLSGITSINGTSWPLTFGTSDFSASNISTSLIPTNTNSIDLGSSSKYLKNAYVRDISLTNMTASGSVVPIVPELVRPALPVGGTVIALNSTGTIVATNIQYISGIGRVRVYEFTNNTWIQVGQDVSMGTTEYTNFGYSIGLNGDGTILAVGAPDKSDSVNALDMAGCVTVYKYTTSWDILGQFYGESAYAMFGSNISLNDSGTVIAIGSRGDQPPNYPYGVVKVYNYINNNWTNIGSINGLIWVGRNGEGLSLNGDGTILAISTSNINQYAWNSPKNGFVNVYRYISGSTWQPYGQQINGTQADEMFGYSISLNYNGNIVAIGSPLYDVSSVSINTGRVLVYKYSDITWELLGNIFNGYAAGDFFGRSVSLNAAGNVLAIGVPYYDVGTTTVSNHSHGRVILYNYNNGWGTPIIINGSPAQRGAGWFVALNRSGTVVGYCQVFDNNGIDAPADYPVTFYINQIANNEGGSIGKNETRWSTSYITNMYSDTIRPMNNGSGSLGASDSVFDIAYLNTLSASKIIASTIRTSNIIATNRVYEINTTSMSWESHNAYAMSQGKTLASILNATENQQVIALLLSNNISRAFIGGIRTYNSNATGQTLSDWRWINGDNWSYTNFMPNQPDQQQERVLEYYTASLSSITHKWNDVNSDGGYGFSSAAVYMSNVDINLLTSKANSANPTFTGTVVLPANTINSSHIADGTILGTDISAGTITEDKLSSAVQTKLNLAGTIPANSINSSHIIDGSILGTDISAGTINLSNLSASAISSLTTLTIPANSINSSHIQNGTITGADIGAYTITDGNILFNSIGNDKLNDLTIQDNKIANTTISLGKLTADAITSLQTTPANSINSSHIIDGSILTADISNNAITNAKIADFSITNSKLDDNSIDSRKIIAGSIFGTDIAINQIGINHLTGLAYLDLVTTQAPDSINSSHIVNGSITGSDIAAGTITSSNILDGTILGEDINGSSLVSRVLTNSYFTENIGTTIPGPTTGSYFGQYIELSGDGRTLAAWRAPSGNGGAIIYRLNSNNQWIQLGSTLFVNSGTNGALALSNDGNTFALGVVNAGNGGVQIYNLNTTTSTWTIVASLTGASSGDWFGSSLSFDLNATTLAIGIAQGDEGTTLNVGKVDIYKFLSPWTYATSIPATAGVITANRKGIAVSLSGSGTRIVIGSDFTDSGSIDIGLIQIYNNTSGNTWTLMASFYGNKDGGPNYFGNSAKISQDGNTVIAGAWQGSYGNGYVRVLRLNNNSWNSLGSQIYTSPDARTGFSVAINADGTIIVVGAPGSNSFSGTLRVYKFNGTNWVEIIPSINGATSANLGSGCAINPAGNVLAYSSPNVNTQTGEVTVLKLDSYLRSTLIEDSSITATTLSSRITNLELTAVTRSYDIIIPNTTVATIPIDFADNDSITINAIFRFYGADMGTNLVVQYRDFYNNNLLLFNYWQIQMNNTNNITENYNHIQGLIMNQMATGTFWSQTNTLELRIYKPFDANLVDPREWHIEGNSGWHKTGIGRSRASFSGKMDYRPKSIVFIEGAGASFEMTYSIVNDKRVTANNIASIPAGISADSALSIENRLKALEDNALISSTDTIISGTTGNQIVIPIDLVNNESVTINFTFQLPGAYNGNEVYISYRTNGVGYNFEEARATTIVHNGNTYVKTGGAITQSIEAQNLSNVFTIKVYRSFTTNTPSQRYLMEGEGAYCVAGQGNARVEFNGMISGRIPNEIFITHGNLYSMSARYSVINNKDSTVISSVSSLASVGSITRKFISSSTNASTIQIPLDFTTYKSVEVEITFTFFGTIWGGSRLRAMYKSSDNVVRDFNYYNLTTLSGRINDPWYREDWGTDSYRGMCMFDMATNLDGDGYWSSGNLKMRIHRGNNPRPDSWSKIYFVSGETNYARAGWGPTQGIINANTIYLPTALLFDTNSTAGTTFNAEWYITGYT